MDFSAIRGAALAFLVEQGMALVDGDQITIPEQFIPKDS